MDRKLRDDRSRLAVSLGVGVAVLAMIAMGLVPDSDRTPSSEWREDNRDVSEGTVTQQGPLKLGLHSQ